MVRASPRILWLACLVPLALLGLEQASLAGYIGGDFRIFHRAVARFLSDPATLYGPAGTPLQSGQTLQGFIYPPPGILALLPFGLGALETDFTLFVTLSTVLAAGALAIWLRLAPPRHAPPAVQVALVLMALASGPAFACRAGQIDLLILALCTAGAWCALGTRPMLGGALLAIGAWIKIYPVLVAVPLVIAAPRGRHVAAGFGLAALAVPALAALAVPPLLWRQYFFELLPQMSLRAIVNIYNQSLAAIWLRTQIPHGQALDSFAAMAVPAPVRLAVASLAIALIALATRKAWRTPSALPMACLVALATISIAAPLGWGHAYVYVIPLWLVLAASAWESRDWSQIGLTGGAWLLLLPSAHHRFTFAAWGEPLWSLTYGRYAIAALLLIALALGGKPGRETARMP